MMQRTAPAAAPQRTGTVCFKPLQGSRPSHLRARLHIRAQAAPRDISARVAATAEAEAPAATTTSAPNWAEMSYSQQYDVLFKPPVSLITNKAIPKPSKEAQASESGATKVLFSDVRATQKHPLFFNRTYNSVDLQYAAFMIAMHGLALLAPFCFSWSNVALFGVTYFVTGCLGITLSFHRQLSHKSFQTPKWLEYALAYCGVMAVQGDPIEWVVAHRYHHLHTDTPLDPHSPYEGFWWSHMGWLLDNQVAKLRVGDETNSADMESQPFYRFIRSTYIWHVVALFAGLYAYGGLPAVVWGGALRLVWVYHITWFVNSASHVWGYQTYDTGDQSRNNWWVGILAWGEGWHNNHHAFEYSARHGLEWWQLDVTWIIIKALQTVGLATKVKLPSQKAKDQLAFPSEAQA